MEQELEFEVLVISNETIQPSFPSSSPPKTFTLSLLDQIFPAFHIPLLLFYPCNPTPLANRVDILGLKASLTQTLDKFYPLAGRFLDDSTVSCNNKGIPVIETKVNTHLSLVMKSPHKLRVLNKFLPPQEFLALGPRKISELVPLAFQINVFLCGGVVISCYMLHKLLDTASLVTFLKHWASHATNCYSDLIQPDFESIVKAFPPLPKVENVFVPDLDKDNSIESSRSCIVAKSFVFNSLALGILKAKAASELVPQPSRFEALAGFIWEQTLAAAQAAANVRVRKTKLSFSVNMRPRMSKPLPKESMGNLVTNVHPQSDATASSFQDFVKEIHSALSGINGKIKRVYEGENGAEVLCQERNAESQGVMVYQEGLYRLSSWCNIGLSEVDFGFGKPTWIVPTYANELPPSLRNFIFFTDYSDGIEVWLFLEGKEMQVLESNPCFLEFASPN